MCYGVKQHSGSWNRIPSPSADWLFGFTEEAGAQAAQTLGCRELREANPLPDTRSGTFCLVLDERLFFKCRIVKKDKAKAKGVPF